MINLIHFHIQLSHTKQDLTILCAHNRQRSAVHYLRHTESIKDNDNGVLNLSDSKYKETLRFLGLCGIVYIIVDVTLTAGTLTALVTIGSTYLK